jgi:hypothetical protein
MHDVKLGKILWASARGVDVMAAEIRTELELLLGRDICEILVTEGNDFSLGYE